MADEFMKGLTIFTAAGLAWMTLSGWYQTPEFESTRQLIEPAPEPTNVFDMIAIGLIDVMMWFALLGALTFWVIIPAARQGRRVYYERRESNN